MPELPEVETAVRALRPQVEGRQLQGASLLWRGTLAKPASPDEFLARLAGQRIERLTRRAKYLVFHLESDWLLVHLKMTGRLYVLPDTASDPDDRWLRCVFQLDGGEQLRFSDARKFGKLFLTADLESIIGALGPEPLEESFTFEAFQSRLQGRKTPLKALLLNQQFVAGVGNIYADEALHYAHLHPLRRADSLDEAQARLLYEGIRHVLRQGIAFQGASVRWYRQPNGERGAMQNEFSAYDRTGQPCLTCGQACIQRIVVAQRGTHFCPACQT
jgi:formamidopyrimidine-DNA glycosylase